jgi:hypothetical protein
VLNQLVLLSMLIQKPQEEIPDVFRQNHISKVQIWVGDTQKTFKLALGPRDRDRAGSGSQSTRLVADLVYENAEIVRKFSMAQARLMRSELERYPIKSVSVLLSEALDERFELVRGCHRYLPV